MCVLVGAGSGDPQLITLAGAGWLAKAQVVVYDRLASPQLLALAPAEAARVYVGKGRDGHAMEQEQINQLLVDETAAGKLVVRLKGGDPFVFGRGGEEADALHAAGLAFRIVPGVTAAIAGGAYAGIPVTDRRLASSVALVTGHEDPTKDASSLNWAALAGIDTLVFYMGVTNLPQIAASLMAAGRGGDTPCAVIERATTPRQRTVTGTLATIAEVSRREGVAPPAITIVGQVVGLRDTLRWFDRLPLHGQTVLVTRTRTQASQLSAQLALQGAAVIESPTIEIAPPADWAQVDRAIDGLARAINGPARAAARAGTPKLRSAALEGGACTFACASDRAYDYLVLTSPNGVEMFFGRLAALGHDSRLLATVRVAAVGPATAAALAAKGIRADLTPREYTTASLGAALLEDARSLALPHPPRVLLARADLANPELAQVLQGSGYDVHDVTVYRTVRPSGLGAEALDALREGRVDWITFTSSSTAENFLSLLAASGLDAPATLAPPTGRRVRLAAIGPVTAATLHRHNLPPDAIADPCTIDALVEAMTAAAVSPK